jgi:hypothetical protein
MGEPWALEIVAWSMILGFCACALLSCFCYWWCDRKNYKDSLTWKEFMKQQRGKNENNND